MDNRSLSVWAAYNTNDKTRYNSSSGGIFSLLAENVIRSGGVVYGIAMSSDCYSAEYVRVDDISGLNAIRGSKYLQAVIGDTYKKVKSDLSEGRMVLFSGVGCQINGLKMFLGREYDNLFCIDVICHGTPSQMIWRMYLKDIESRHGKVKKVSFRSKQNSWEDFGMLEDTDGKSLFISKDEDTYMRFFLRNYDLRPSCYNCHAKTDKRSDITLADFWGINNVDSSMNDGKGTSLVIVRTKKGRRVFDEIRPQLICKQVSYDDGVRDNPAEYTSVNRPAQRDKLFDDAKSLSYPDLVRKYKCDRDLPVSLKHRIKMKCISILRRISKIGGGQQNNNRPELNYGMLFRFEDNER